MVSGDTIEVPRSTLDPPEVAFLFHLKYVSSIFVTSHLTYVCLTLRKTNELIFHHPCVNTLHSLGVAVQIQAVNIWS